MSKCHAMTLTFEVLCGTRPRTLRSTIINGRKNDRLAKLITCKTCRRIWRRLTT